jgi:hypothetical protein
MTPSRSNTVKRFPTVLIAGPFGYKEKPYFAAKGARMSHRKWISLRSGESCAGSAIRPCALCSQLAIQL